MEYNAIGPLAGAMVQARDWSNMPSEILVTIYSILCDSEFDRHRIRAVCTSWRTALSEYLLPEKSPLVFPKLMANVDRTSGSSWYWLLRQTVFYIVVSTSSSCSPWLTRIEVGPKKCLLQSLFSGKLRPWSELSLSRQYEFNLLDNHRFLQIAKSYTLELEIHNRGQVHRAPFPKVVVTPNFKMTLVLDSLGQLFLTRSRKDWVAFRSREHSFSDIICFRGELWAIDSRGILARIQPTEPKPFQVMTAPLERDRIVGCMHLVESDGRLYVVVKVLFLQQPIFGSTVGQSSIRLQFRIYLLNEQSKAWEEVDNLGNKMFFLTNHVSFSLSASDLGCSKGNLIFFTDCQNRTCNQTTVDGPPAPIRFGIFNLEDRKFIADWPDYCTGFVFLPPSWLVTKVHDPLHPTV